MPNRATVWQGQLRSVWNALLPNPEALSSSLHGCSCATNGFVMVHCIRTCTLPPLSQHFVRSVSSSLFPPWRFVLARSLSLLFFSLSLFLFFPREIHSILSRYHEVIILTAFVALLRFANLKITYIFFRFSVGLRFCYFWICKFYIAYYMLLEIKVEYLNGNWEIGENLYNFITIRMLYECTRIVLKMIDKCFDFKRSRKRIILVF